MSLIGMQEEDEERNDWNPEKSKLASFVLLGSQDTIRSYRIRHRYRHRDGGRPATDTLRLGNKVAQDEGGAPFGGSMPKATVGAEVNLRTSKTLRHRNRPHRVEHEYEMDAFATRLNWATDENPDGVPLVHAVVNQGNCGSCWAYAATGSLETSVARGVAQSAFQRGMSLEDVRDLQVQVFNQTRLSIQELLDCDRVVDQSCVGGNPLLAFYYIHQHGLTTWDGYPYDGLADAQCRRRPEVASRASVDAWGVLPTNQEDLIEIALRYIGPVAAAINGGDPYFMAYKGGIFENPYCRQEPNHAVLITGYGEELDPVANTTVRYWIARNSWGTTWGEEGFVRLRRGLGKKDSPGVCGVARSVSVALGGRLLVSSQWSSRATTTSQGEWDSSWEGLDTDMYIFCNAITPQNSLYHARCRRLVDSFNSHRVAALASLSLLMVLLLAWPLTHSCRRRAEARRFRKKFSKGHEPKSRQQQQYSRDGINVEVPLTDDTEGPFRVLDDTFDNENTPLLGGLAEETIAFQSCLTPSSLVDSAKDTCRVLGGLSQHETEALLGPVDPSPFHGAVSVVLEVPEVPVSPEESIVVDPTTPMSVQVLEDAMYLEESPLALPPAAPSSPLTEGTLSISSVEESEHQWNDGEEDDNKDGNLGDKNSTELPSLGSRSPLKKYGGLALLYGTSNAGHECPTPL